MTDDLTYGLGYIPSPHDDRDWTIDQLYVATGTDVPLALPTSYIVPGPYPGILDQGSSPQCVAYSTSYSKAYQDLKDQGPFNFDENRFFREIGGTSSGAVLRYALARMVGYGYPVAGQDISSEAQHKIRAYYSIPVSKIDIQNAINAFGVVVLGVQWADTWFSPYNGVLRSPSGYPGGHALCAVGWDSRGLRLRNSWGTAWGLGGDAFMPWAYIGRVREAWKTVDVIEPKPNATYRLNIAAGAVVKIAALAPCGIKGWTNRQWGSRPSSAPCGAPMIRPGCYRGQATIVRVTAGVFAGKYVHVGQGVTVTRA